MHWFTIEWWRYLLTDLEFREYHWKDIEANGEDFLYEPLWTLHTLWWQLLALVNTVSCRVRGHPYGVAWHSISALEPDMHCLNCGDDLG